jgi:ferredoxin-NADP reductase
MPKAVEAGQSWHGPIGGFSMDTLKAITPDFREREVFVCGPGGFMDMIRATLAAQGHPEQRYHQESFGAAPAAANSSRMTPSQTALPDSGSAAQPSVMPAEQILPIQIPEKSGELSNNTGASQATAPQVNFSKSGKTFACNEGDTLLELAEANDIIIESSCRAGNCGTCKVKKLLGKVDMEGQQALSEADIADGFVLCCIGKPISSKVVLEA